MIKAERFGEVVIVSKDNQDRMYLTLEEAMKLYAQLTKELGACE